MDILVERTIAASPEAVARVMFDPRRDPEWIGGAKAVEPLTSGALGVGYRVRRTGGMPFWRFSWVTEVASYEPGRRLEMIFVEGPLKGGVAYAIRPEAGGSVASVRNHGGSGPAWLLKRFVGKDLERLAGLVV